MLSDFTRSIWHELSFNNVLNLKHSDLPSLFLSGETRPIYYQFVSISNGVTQLDPFPRDEIFTEAPECKGFCGHFVFGI